jgi:hypothetical protein
MRGKEQAMDFKTCVSSKDGTVYCFDKDQNTWVKLRATPVETRELPPDVVEQLIKIALDEMDKK